MVACPGKVTCAVRSLDLEAGAGLVAETSQQLEVYPWIGVGDINLGVLGLQTVVEAERVDELPPPPRLWGEKKA